MNIEDHPGRSGTSKNETPVAVVDDYLVTWDSLHVGWWWVYGLDGCLRGGINKRGTPTKSLAGGKVSESTVQTILAPYRLHH